MVSAILAEPERGTRRRTEWRDIESLVVGSECERVERARTWLPITPRLLRAAQRRELTSGCDGWSPPGQCPPAVRVCVCVCICMSGWKTLLCCPLLSSPRLPLLSALYPPDSLMSDLLAANAPRGCRIFLTCPASKRRRKCQGRS